MAHLTVHVMKYTYVCTTAPVNFIVKDENNLTQNVTYLIAHVVKYVNNMTLSTVQILLTFIYILPLTFLRAI